MKSTDGGQTWTWLSSTDGNPLYGLSCPSTTVCYATDIYAHVIKTTDGGASWAFQTTPITTPLVPVVAETGGPNPWGGLMGISCSDVSTCVGVGIYATVSGQTNPDPDPPIVTTTDGGATWTRQVSGTGTGNFLALGLVPCGHDHVHGRRPRRQDRDHDQPHDVDGRDVGHDEHAEQRPLPEHFVLHGGRPERDGRRLERHDLDCDHR